MSLRPNRPAEHRQATNGALVRTSHWLSVWQSVTHIRCNFPCTDCYRISARSRRENFLTRSLHLWRRYTSNCFASFGLRAIPDPVREETEENSIMGDANVNRQASAVTSIKRITTEVLADAYAGDQFVLQQQLQTLQRHFENLTLIHENLLGTVQANGVDALDTLLADMETRYNGAMAKLQRMLAAIEPAVQLRNMDDGASSVSNATVHQRVPGVKLEALKIPKFDGQLENWLAFKDAFETLIHSQEWPEAYKLGKLGDYLGDGAKSVLGARYTGGYEAAWAAVIKRFHKPRYLASIHISIKIAQYAIRAAGDPIEFAFDRRYSWRYHPCIDCNGITGRSMGYDSGGDCTE